MHPESRSERTRLEIVLTLLIVVLVALCGYLFVQLSRAPSAALVESYRHHYRLPPLYGTAPVATSTAISSIQPWMTFGYLNRVFDIPEGYLASGLSISDTRYPEISIAEYAKDAATSSASALLDVQGAIAGYHGAQ